MVFAGSLRGAVTLGARHPSVSNLIILNELDLAVGEPVQRVHDTVQPALGGSKLLFQQTLSMRCSSPVQLRLEADRMLDEQNHLVSRTFRSSSAWIDPEYRQGAEILLGARAPPTTELVADLAQVPEEQPRVHEAEHVVGMNPRTQAEADTESAARHEAELLVKMRQRGSKIPIRKEGNQQVCRVMDVQVPRCAEAVHSLDLLPLLQHTPVVAQVAMRFRESLPEFFFPEQPVASIADVVREDEDLPVSRAKAESSVVGGVDAVSYTHL